MATFEFGFPELGEGLHEGRIARWLVKPGDAVKEDDALAEVENDKATVELPSPVDGVIQELRVGEGDVATVGQVVAVITVEATESQASPTLAEAGLTTTVQAVAHAQAPSSTGPTVVSPPSGAALPPAAAAQRAGDDRQAVRAAPSVRKLAREHGVNLALVRPAEDSGIIRAQDVLAFVQSSSADELPAADARAVQAAAASNTGGDRAHPASATPEPMGSVHAGDQRVALSGVRRAIATAMSKSAFTAPHVTIMDEVDVTALVALREQMKPVGQERGIKLTYLPFVVKALIAAVRHFPQLNAELDESAGELIVKSGRHVGIATDT
ncbi:MAG: dihydrolipoamide acetyltransferase family protein, partial [Firmicutes bacterium]|nr:dihydrolipoamide acetyltransferase family protein [Bacillota bacterium]